MVKIFGGLAVTGGFRSIIGPDHTPVTVALGLMMTIPMNAPDVLDREFLTMRAKTLELAASLDRLDRASADHAATIDCDRRLELLREGFKILLTADGDRAERVQKLYSLEYHEDWHTRLGVPRD